MKSEVEESVMEITVEKPDQSTLKDLDVENWPTWSKEVSRFSWKYSSQETAYILEGEVTVTPDEGAPVTFGAGDLVIFPAGMSCVWEVKKPLRKHYQFD